MLNLTTDMSVPSVQRVIDILTYHNKLFGIPLDFDRMQEYYSLYTLKGYNMLQRIVDYTTRDSSVKYSVFEYKDDHFRDFLQRAGVAQGLIMTPGRKPSLSSESLQGAIATGLYSDELNSVMQLYSDMKSCFQKVNVFPNIFDRYPIVKMETWDNHRMIIVRPEWTAQNTGRVGASNPGIMNISRDLKDIFTVPKGWIYFEADSGQIEPRLNQSFIIKDPQLKQCTMLYNDAYFGYIHYCEYLTDEQRRSGTLDFKAVELTDEQKAKRKKFKTFGNAVMYGSKENRLNDPDKAAFIKYIGGHPARVKLQQERENAVDRGQRVFYTAFGTPIDISKGPSENKYTDKTSSAYFSHLVKQSINNPVQGTAADMMRLSVTHANSLLSKKAPKSFILQYVHDSGKFMIHEDDYDKVIDELREITSYQVEDWIPIYSDYSEGVHQGDMRRLLA